MQTTIDLQPKKLLSPKRLSKSVKEKPPSQISVEDVKRNWPFTRLDGRLLEKLHKQTKYANLEEALL